LSGNPLGYVPDVSALQHRVGRVSLRGSLANALRNLSLHATTPSGHLNFYAQDGAIRTIRWLKQVPSDPAYLSDIVGPDVNAYWRFRISPPNRHETWAGDPLSLTLITVALGTIFFRRARGFDRRASIYALGLIASFIAFSALVRWQGSGARIQIPFFALGAPLIGYAIEKTLSPLWAAAIGALMIMAAIPFVLGNELRPLIPTHYLPHRYIGFEPLVTSVWSRTRGELYFADQHLDLARPYINAAEALHKQPCDEIGIDNSLEH